ncbi:MAG: hypothetical protein [Ninurtavirus cruti]|uniref:Uncharacterized protein n=1 Tax=Cressdnaviricota sp. TaxID=2748378 RepID=A0A3G2YST7_9VIRU|nr:MAG: hypothetical protein [Cressdnaviricota sp.]
MTWPPVYLKTEDKGYIGASQSHIMASPPSSPTPATGSRDNLNSVNMDTSIGRLSVTSSPRSPLSQYAQSLDLGTPNLADLTQQVNTSGRKTLVSTPQPDSNSADYPLKGIHLLTGTPFYQLLNPATIAQFPLIFKFAAVTNCKQLAVSMQDQWVWSASAMFTMAPPQLVNLEELGMKQGWMLTQRIREPSGGMGISLTQMLCSMNSVVPSMSLTFSCGSTGIQCLWKAKVLQCRCAQQPSGSLLTWLPPCGSPIWTHRL